MKMKNVSSIKSTSTIDSPKTPGGISKSLLTPCRRLGLSRNWRKKGPSPFVSPLSNSQSIVPQSQETSTKKRKKDLPEKRSYADENHKVEDFEGVVLTPSRTDCVRKKSKVLVLNQDCQENDKFPETTDCDTDRDGELENSNKTNISKLSRNKSKGKIHKGKSPRKENETVKISEFVRTDTVTTDELESNSKATLIHSIPEKTKSNSPNNLSKECIVVIQNEIFSNIQTSETEVKLLENCTKPSQVLNDSDSDDVPLHLLSKRKNILPTKDLNLGDKSIVKITKAENRKTPSDFNAKQINKTKVLKTKSKIESKLSQNSNSFDDNDDDDDFDERKTIIIKKSYEKVAKPSKAKSTGSITDKDIIELKARIDMKKKMLMAKALGNDTEDLRCLIKKWQKGCQDALVELMELMKKKMPEQQNLENAQLLQMLKIPPDLVGYDSENDCFILPNDENIILSSLKI